MKAVAPSPFIVEPMEALNDHRLLCLQNLSEPFIYKSGSIYHGDKYGVEASSEVKAASFPLQPLRIKPRLFCAFTKEISDTIPHVPHRTVAVNKRFFAYSLKSYSFIRVVSVVTQNRCLLREHEKPIQDFCFSLFSENIIVTAAVDGSIVFLYLEETDNRLTSIMLGKFTTSEKNFHSLIVCAAFDPQEKALASSSKILFRMDHQLYVAYPAPAISKATFPSLKEVPHAFLCECDQSYTLSSDGSWAAVANKGIVMTLLLPSSSKHQLWMPHDGEAVRDLAFSHTNDALLTFSTRNTFRFWNIRESTPQCLQTIHWGSEKKPCRASLNPIYDVIAFKLQQESKIIFCRANKETEKPGFHLVAELYLETSLQEESHTFFTLCAFEQVQGTVSAVLRHEKGISSYDLKLSYLIRKVTCKNIPVHEAAEQRITQDDRSDGNVLKLLSHAQLLPADSGTWSTDQDDCRTRHKEFELPFLPLKMDSEKEIENKKIQVSLDSPCQTTREEGGKRKTLLSSFSTIVLSTGDEKEKEKACGKIPQDTLAKKQPHRVTELADEINQHYDLLESQMGIFLTESRPLTDILARTTGQSVEKKTTGMVKNPSQPDHDSLKRTGSTNVTQFNLSKVQSPNHSSDWVRGKLVDMQSTRDIMNKQICKTLEVQLKLLEDDILDTLASEEPTLVQQLQTPKPEEFAKSLVRSLSHAIKKTSVKPKTEIIENEIKTLIKLSTVNQFTAQEQIEKQLQEKNYDEALRRILEGHHFDLLPWLLAETRPLRDWVEDIVDGSFSPENILSLVHVLCVHLSTEVIPFSLKWIKFLRDALVSYKTVFTDSIHVPVYKQICSLCIHALQGIEEKQTDLHMNSDFRDALRILRTLGS